MVLLARKDEEGNTQALYDHLHGAGRLASGFEDEFADISRTAAVLHDVGKVAQQFQTYLLSDDGHRGDVQHARQGAFVVNDFFESKGEIEEIAKEILELAISKHHGGLPDCIDESGNRAFLLGFTESDKSNEKYAYQEIKRGLNGLALDLQSNFRGSAEDIACFLKKIKSLGMSKDSIYFYLGLLVKLIYSRLVDADRTDAACFETRKQYRPNTVDWQNLISRLDKSMRSFDSSSEINRIRHQINEQCCLAGARETGIYRLSIPTGGGKTLASLNFALHHALKTGKHRIIYVIPYLSITTQTAKTFRDVLGLNADSDVHKSNDGVPLHGRDELWLPYPIEYKHGKSKTIDADRLQLCAEAMCLEEMLACDIPEGALFYQQTKRRERVKFDEDLRNMVEADFLQMHDLFSRGWTPKVKQTRSCSACSLRDLCLPELRKMKSAKAYIEERLKESGE